MRKESKPKVTIDTNLIVSGMISASTLPSKVLSAWMVGQFTWILTDETYAEIEHVLHRGYIKDRYLSEEQITDMLTALSVAADFVTPLNISLLPIRSRDSKDDKFLACALAGNCDYLITGDKDLLVLNGVSELGKLKIVTAAEFLHKDQP